MPLNFDILLLMNFIFDIHRVLFHERLELFSNWLKFFIWKWVTYKYEYPLFLKRYANERDV